MCSLNMFQVSLGGLFVFKYLHLLRQFLRVRENLEMEKMTTSVDFSWAAPGTLLCLHPPPKCFSSRHFLSTTSDELIQQTLA